MKTTKRLIVALLLFALMPIVASAQTVVDGIKYNIIGEKTVEVAGMSEKKAEVVIPPTVIIDGKSYTVETIGKNAFYKSSIQEISLPTTIKVIGKWAFGCSSLNKIKLPIGLERIEERGFVYCYNLRYVSFPPSLTYLGQSCFFDCHNCVAQEGYHGEIKIGGGCFFESPIKNQIESNEYQSTFSYNYAYKIYKAMQEWQKKKDFETTDQWRTRVTTQTRERKMRQFVSQFKQEFAKTMGTKATPNFSINLYDDDYNVYSLESEGFGVVYVSVPSSEKESFKSGFTSSKVSPVYCVKDDKLAVASVTVTIGNKTYTSPSMVNESADDGDLAMELPPLDFNLKDDNASAPVVRTATYDKSLDENIPVSDRKATNTFVIAIGNENYQLVPRVAFAENDINVFSQYCQKTLGVPMQNIRKYKDATFGVMLSALKDLKDIADAYNGDLNVIFYYAGHGIPGESDQSAYLLPADADGKQVEVCFPVTRLYSELSALNAKSVVVFMDACFSGAQRGEGMLASARGVAIKPKAEKPQGNMIVFSAASSDETAYPYREKGHGLFTYFLLKKLQETKGDVTLGELSQYITTNVKRQSVVTNRKSQTPTVVPSVSVESSWESIKLH